MMNIGRKMNRENKRKQFEKGYYKNHKCSETFKCKAQIAGHLSIGLLIGALIQGFLYLSLAGGIWCVGYMISEYFKESK